MTYIVPPELFLGIPSHTADPAAAALRKLGRSEEATAALLKAATAASTAPAAGTPPNLHLQAQVQYKLGQHLRSTEDPASCALAAEAYGRCLKLDPGHTLAGFWLSATKKLAAVRGEEGVSGERRIVACCISGTGLGRLNGTLSDGGGARRRQLIFK